MAISGEGAATSIPSPSARTTPKAPVEAEDSCFECNICLDGVKEPVVTRCGHLFCWPCLYRWLNTNQTECPVCKAGVTATNVIPLYGRGADGVDPRTKSSGSDGVPSRPEAERPQAEMRRPSNPFGGGPLGGGWGGFGGVGGIEGGVAGGQLHFQAGLGFFPSLFGLQFQSFTFPAAQTASAGAERASGGRAQEPQAGGTSTSSAGGSASATGSSPGSGSASTDASQSQGRMVTPEEAQQAFLSRLLLVLGSFVVMCLVLF